MPACATQEKVARSAPVSNLFLPVPDTDLRAFLDEVAELARFAPEIITAIEKDRMLTPARRRSCDWRIGSSTKARQGTCPTWILKTASCGAMI